jgi:DNA mismatch repair protein MutL
VGFRWADLHLVGQTHLTYIVAQSEDALYLVDQHAAHERVVFERLMISFESGKMDVQTLLLPLSVDLPEPEVDALLNAADHFTRLGLSLERMGPSTLVVQTLPSLIQEGAVVRALERSARELVSTGGALEAKRMVGDVFATMACHSVVRAGQSMSLEQMKQLLVQMDEFPLSSFCPHGRPVYIRRAFSDIEREFGRIN